MLATAYMVLGSIQAVRSFVFLISDCSGQLVTFLAREPEANDLGQLFLDSSYFRELVDKFDSIHTCSLTTGIILGWIARL